MINIILADDHNVVRNGIKLLLEADPNIDSVAEAVSGMEVLNQLKSGRKVDIVLADLNMPEMSGMELLAEVKENHPQIPVVILTMIDDNRVIADAFSNGARGYLLKHIGAEELIYSLTHVLNGGRYVSTHLSQLFLKRVSDDAHTSSGILGSSDFSSRELEVLNLIAEGSTNNEMAEKLFLSIRTIEGHRQSLIDKTKSKNTASLIKYAVMNGLVL